ncbi:MAG: ornithine carbamoyltransferase, partial [Coriobacteriia bacterium]
ISNDPADAVADAEIVTTDTWASMGQEAEHAERMTVFEPFTVTPELMASAASDAVFMHCLPAHRGEEVLDEVIDAPYSIIFDEAENRLHAQKALLSALLG